MTNPYKLFRINEKNQTYTALSELSASDIIAMARRLVSYRVRRGACLTSPKDTKDYLLLELATLEHEVFCCFFLDAKHCVIHFEKLFFGTIDGASVHPREVVKKALQYNAAAVIFAHNHPSGSIQPSQADIRITKRLTEALALIDVRVLDHLVIGEGEGEGESSSFAEQGLF